MTAPGGPSGESAPDGPSASEHPPTQPAEQPVYPAPWASPASSEAVDYPSSANQPPAYQPPVYPQPGYQPPAYQPPPGHQPYPPMPPPYGAAPGGYGPSYPDPYQYHGGYYPPPEYPGGYGASGTNTLAIASLVTSIAGVLCCGTSSIVGIVLGTIALNQIKQTREEGYGLAVAGIVIGVAALLIYLIVFLFSIPSR
ncbi:DUF4190 domain-containing protein [Mycobacterium angelicum]|uniref:DUF4190 domain-containing protein n=1 Tax=Mycobacterium angelicum TaxID=470074 RepID=A0A1W9ZLU8_MYCAN|nr:DUF4190 domain-containing protein [Mycobacterium angelicum]MCV7196025.1 DUF4190 domain-containing protein [Mycobacterium angelicum]ORA18416.1 hypothetical protein BST12_18800 [Mycobacterium angelicum]